MNDYPDSRYPNSISYDIGRLNVSESSTLTSGPIRFRHSNKLNSHQITFRYSDLTQTEVSLLRQHYLEAAGTHNKFKIPQTIFGGAGITSSTSFYRYASTPNENQRGVYHDIEISVVALIGNDLTYLLFCNGATDQATSTTSGFSLFSGTSPFYLFCKDAAGHSTSDIEYTLTGGDASGV